MSRALLLVAAITPASAFTASQQALLARPTVVSTTSIAPMLYTAPLSGSQLPSVLAAYNIRRNIRACLSDSDSPPNPARELIEYAGFALLAFWGIFCVALNYFLWIFRFAIEKSGLAPSSWNVKDAKPKQA